MDEPATRPNSRLHPDSIFTTNNKEFTIRGMNYYPQQHPWTAMWSNFETSALSADLQLIRQLGFNTIRVFIPFEDFGKAEVLPEKLSQFKQLLDLAHQSDLKVIVTLFDFFLGYRIEEWTLSDRHAETIVMSFKDHPALLAWDVKNEPDLDFENIGEKEVKEWLNFIMQRIRTYDPTTPITIGWSQPEAMIHLQDQVDFLSFHYYRSPEDLATILEDLPSDKPIFLGETGSHSFDSWWYPFKRSEEDQLDFYQGIGEVISDKKLHYAFWTLYDFQSIPSNVAGKWPWQKGPQKSYGLIDRNGVPKSTYQWTKNFNQSNNER